MARSALLFILVAVIALSFAPKAYAFGAGESFESDAAHHVRVHVLTHGR
jgi:hypothetical protein